MKKYLLIGVGMAAIGVGAFAVAHDRGQGMRGEGPRGDRGARMERMFERFDANSDGKITREEIDGLRTQRFQALDANGDGAVDAAEMMAAAQARLQERVTRRIERMDTDKDGKLTQAEFEAARGAMRQGRRGGERRRGAGRRGGRGGDMFQRFDANSDGEITREEVQNRSQRREWRFGNPGGRHHGWNN